MRLSLDTGWKLEGRYIVSIGRSAKHKLDEPPSWQPGTSGLTTLRVFRSTSVCSENCPAWPLMRLTKCPSKLEDWLGDTVMQEVTKTFEAAIKDGAREAIRGLRLVGDKQAVRDLRRSGG